jgi:hypothetical protein
MFDEGGRSASIGAMLGKELTRRIQQKILAREDAHTNAPLRQRAQRVDRANHAIPLASAGYSEYVERERNPSSAVLTREEEKSAWLALLLPGER